MNLQTKNIYGSVEPTQRFRTAYDLHRLNPRDELLHDIFLAVIKQAVSDWKMYLKDTDENYHYSGNSWEKVTRSDIVYFFNDELCDLYLKFCCLDITAEDIRNQLGIPTMTPDEIKRMQLVYGVY